MMTILKVALGGSTILPAPLILKVLILRRNVSLEVGPPMDLKMKMLDLDLLLDLALGRPSQTSG